MGGVALCWGLGFGGELYSPAYPITPSHNLTPPDLARSALHDTAAYVTMFVLFLDVTIKKWDIQSQKITHLVLDAALILYNMGGRGWARGFWHDTMTNKNCHFVLRKGGRRLQFGQKLWFKHLAKRPMLLPKINAIHITFFEGLNYCDLCNQSYKNKPI